MTIILLLSQKTINSLAAASFLAPKFLTWNMTLECPFNRGYQGENPNKVGIYGPFL